MWDNEHLKRMMEMAEDQSKKVDLNMAVFNETFKGVIANAPSEQVGKLEKLQSSIKKATELAKQGKTLEAQQILNNLQNEC